MRGSGSASAPGASFGRLALTPLEHGVDRIERRDGTPGVVLAEGERSRQHAQLSELSLRPLDTPARRKAPVGELRDVPLQTDR